MTFETKMALVKQFTEPVSGNTKRKEFAKNVVISSEDFDEKESVEKNAKKSNVILFQGNNFSQKEIGEGHTITDADLSLSGK